MQSKKLNIDTSKYRIKVVKRVAASGSAYEKYIPQYNRTFLFGFFSEWIDLGYIAEKYDIDSAMKVIEEHKLYELKRIKKIETSYIYL
jgi:hypothetical protein